MSRIEIIIFVLLTIETFLFGELSPWGLALMEMEPFILNFLVGCLHLEYCFLYLPTISVLVDAFFSLPRIRPWLCDAIPVCISNAYE